MLLYQTLSFAQGRAAGNQASMASPESFAQGIAVRTRTSRCRLRMSVWCSLQASTLLSVPDRSVASQVGTGCPGSIVQKGASISLPGPIPELSMLLREELPAVPWAFSVRAGHCAASRRLTGNKASFAARRARNWGRFPYHCCHPSKLDQTSGLSRCSTGQPRTYSNNCWDARTSSMGGPATVAAAYTARVTAIAAEPVLLCTRGRFPGATPFCLLRQT